MLIKALLTALVAVLLQATGFAFHLTSPTGLSSAAVLATTAMTLLDYAKRLDPNDQVARIIELLAQTNQILEDMPFMEGNLITGHRTTVRTGLPDVFWRLLNQGVLTSKSRTAQIDEQCGMLEAYSQVDRDLADLGGNAGGVRLSEARAFLEAMNQEMASTLIYGSASAPEEFIGLAARYSSLSAGNADNIIPAGGTGSTYDLYWLNTSDIVAYYKAKAGLG